MINLTSWPSYYSAIMIWLSYEFSLYLDIAEGLLCISIQTIVIIKFSTLLKILLEEFPLQSFLIIGKNTFPFSLAIFSLDLSVFVSEF